MQAGAPAYGTGMYRDLPSTRRHLRKDATSTLFIQMWWRIHDRRETHEEMKLSQRMAELQISVDAPGSLYAGCLGPCVTRGVQSLL